MKSRLTLTFCLPLVVATPLLLPQPSHAANLSEIYELAEARDSVIQASRAQYEAALEALPLARSALLPQVAVAADVAVNESNNDNNGSFGSDTIGASVTQPVFNLTASRSFKRAKATVAQAEATLKDAEQTLLFRTSQAYFNILTAREAFIAARSSREATASQTEQAERRFDVGLSAITDVKEAQAQLDLAIASEIVAENQLALAKEAMRVIINQEVPPLDGLKDDAELTAPAPASVEEWIAVATENNPQLEVARRDFELAEVDIGIERAGRFPTVALTGGYQDLNTESLSQIDNESGQISLQLEYAIFTSGRTSSLIRQAKSQSNQASFNLETVRRAVVQETRDAYLTVLSDISQSNALEKALNSTEVAKEATQAGFDAGTRTAVEVLVSLQDTFNAFADYAAARHQYVISSLELRLAAGILARKHIDSISSSLSPSK